MENFLNGRGFLGTHATFRSDASLILILLSMVLLAIGWQLKVHGREKIHCRFQTIAVILNTSVIAVVMIMPFLTAILPGIPGKLLEGSYGITTVHALTGSISMIFGIYVVLSANKLLPRRMRFKNYKLFMSTSLLLYLFTALLGIAVYLIVFIGGV
jgi:uncharacterized membrane protein YozB (DUF420 family)